jgi:putative RNA 2'-phosphotransferase
MMRGSKNITKVIEAVLSELVNEYEIEFDVNGFTDIDELLTKLNNKGVKITRNDIERSILNSYKQVFSINKDGSKIRANPGPSITFDTDHRDG